MQRLHIFRPGRHTAADGRVIEFTASDLEASAKAYDPARHEAPLVVGHPSQDAPAYGWVGSLMYREEGLDALPHQVDAGFAEIVAAGRFKKISASFYLPDAAQNPVPGCYYLRHVGFLGAAAPAVKGLRPVAFAESEEGVIEFMEPWQQRAVASLFRRLRDWIIESAGLEKADQVIPDCEISGLEPAPEPASIVPAFSEPNHPAPSGHPSLAGGERQEDEMSAEEKARLAALEAENATFKANAASFAEREAAIAAAEREARRRGIAEFVEALVKAGKILPREQAGLIAFMDSLAADGVIEFAEGTEQKSMKVPDWFRTWLDTLPVRVDYSERAPAGGEQLDANDAEAIAKKATEYREAEAKAGRTISVTQAVGHVTKAAK